MEKKIMVVEDSEIDRFIINRLFSGMHPVPVSEFYSNPVKALKAIETGYRPDIIFLNLHLPILSGFQLLDRLSEIWQGADCIIFILTNSINPEEKEQLIRHPLVACWVQKPMTAERLEECKIKFFNY